jgi:uncharacterized protein (TIGR03083 family)
MVLVTDDRPEPVALMRALRASQRRLADTLAVIPAGEVGRPAYTKDWTVAQVASHLGSGAETFLLFLAAGLDGTAAPGVEQFQPIWDRWNAKPPNDQVQDALAVDAAFLDAVDALSEAQQDAWRLQMFGGDRDLAGLLRMRLAEHALHTWDIAVVLDPAAVLPADVAGLVVENLSMIVQYVAKPAAPTTVRIETVEPALVMELALDPAGSRLDLTAAAVEPGTPALRMPAEAFVRLLYGRLDPDHTPPSVQADPGQLDALRSTFPGV